MDVPGQLPCCVRNTNVKKKLEKTAAMPWGSSLNWRKIKRYNSLKTGSAGSAPHVRQARLQIAHMYLTCTCKYLESISKLYTNTVKRWNQNVSEKVNVTSRNFTHYSNIITPFLQDWEKVNLTRSIQNNIPTVRAKIWKCFTFQVKE